MTRSSAILIGDININLLDQDGSARYNNVLNSNFFKPFITNIPTRCTDTTSTLIDHIYSNITDLFCDTGVINMDISDHRPIICVLKDLKLKFSKHTVME